MERRADSELNDGEGSIWEDTWTWTALTRRKRLGTAAR